MSKCACLRSFYLEIEIEKVEKRTTNLCTRNVLELAKCVEINVSLLPSLYLFFFIDASCCTNDHFLKSLMFPVFLGCGVGGIEFLLMDSIVLQVIVLMLLSLFLLPD